MKPKLCRSSWRAFAFTFPSTSPREALLACPPSPTWNLPCFTVESTLSSPCSLALIPFSLAKVRLSLTFTFLPTHDLVLWTDGSVPFPFAKDGSGVLANCSRCGTEATLSFSIGPVCSRYSAEACAILQALFLVSAAPTSLPFFFPFFSSLTPALSLPPCLLLHLSFYLNISGRFSRNCVLSSPVLSGYNGSPDTRFSQGTMRLMSWPDGERYSYPLQSLVVSLFHLSHPLLSFSNWGRTFLSKFFDTQLVSIFTEELDCAPSSRSLCSPSSLLQPTQPNIKLLSLQDWQNQETLQRLWTLVPGHLLSHSALSSYGLFAPLALWQLSVSLRPLVQALESYLASRAPWSSAMPPSPGRGRVATTAPSRAYLRGEVEIVCFDRFLTLTKKVTPKNGHPKFTPKTPIFSNYPSNI